MRPSHRSRNAAWVGGPKSRRAREDRDAAIWPFGISDILKSHYTLDYDRPKWAREARKRGWLTLAAFINVRADVPTGGFRRLIYSDNPFYRLVTKKAQEA